MFCLSVNCKILAQGGELLSNYGFKSNEELLAGYGFALGPRNPADFFHIALRLGPASSGARPTAARTALTLAWECRLDTAWDPRSCEAQVIIVK